MKTLYGILKAPFFGKYRVPWRWPAEANEADWERITIPSRSGGVLAAIHGPARSEAQAALLLAHPMGRAAKGHWLKTGLADTLRDRGFHVLAFDFNGFGESGEGNFRYPLDVIAAGEALRDRYPDLPTGVHGASFGAAWALCACAQEDHPFDWAVLENPFTTLGEFWVRYKLANAVLKTIATLRPSLERSLNPEYQAPRLHGLQSLQLHFGADDTTTPVEMGERLLDLTRKSSLAISELKVWTEAQHNQCYSRWRDEYLDSWLAGAY